MKDKKYPDVLTVGRILSIILALFLAIVIIISYIKTKFSVLMLIFALVIDALVALAYYLNHKNKILISSRGQVSILGKNVGNSQKEDYYTYIGRAILHVEFNIKNINKVYLPTNEELKEARFLEKYFVSNSKKTVCVEFKEPLRYKPTSSPLKIGRFENMKRIYVSVANPNQLLRDLRNFNNN